MVTDDFKKQAVPALEGFRKDMVGIRTGRPNPALVENLKINYYSETLALKQVGSVGILPPRTIIIQVWDKEAVAGVLKAIETSGLNLSANQEGNTIKIILPELSEERRQEIIKHVRRLAEERRIQIRHLRDEINKEIQTLFDDREITEDEKFKLKDGIQKEVEKTNEEIERIVESKIAEIRE